jgi:L-malate glycosyltransferase
MKILHIDTGRIFRGGQRQVYLLIKGLSVFDVEQHLACPSNSPLKEKTSQYVGGFFDLPDSNLMRFMSRGDLKQYVEDNKIDIVHAHDSHAHSLVWFLGINILPIKFVVTRRSSGQIGFGSRGKYRIKGINYIAISNHVKQMLVNGGVPESATAVISSMIDGDLLNVNKTEKSDKTKTEKIILSAGAFDKKKGFDDALRAVEKLRKTRNDFKYYLYGDGPQREAYSKYIKKSGLDDIVVFGGWYNNPVDTIPHGDIFLSPSHQEGLNMSIVEAMALSVPVVASDIPPHRENIKDGENGLLFRVGDIEAMARKINLLLEDNQLACNLATKAHKTASRFDSKIISEYIYNLYRQIVA